MSQKLSNEDWKYLEKKYGNLLRYIANGIFGDAPAHSKEDSYSDLCVSVINAVNGYAKREKQDFKEFKDKPKFIAYLKTSLWNTQNTKRAYITPRRAIRATELLVHTRSKENVVFDEELTLIDRVEDTSYTCNQYYESFDYLSSLSEDYKDIIRVIFKHPKCILDNGRVNVAYLVNKLKLNHHILNLRLYELGEKLKLEL